MLEVFLLIVSLCSCLIMVYGGVELFFGMKKMSSISEVEPTTAADVPKVSVIIPACNEEKTIEKALLSLLLQNYPNLEIVVVNDRSTDRTLAVVEQIALRFPELLIQTITELPVGWMGKSHALSVGAEIATGEYLLFTDADIVMDKNVISRAVHRMISNNIDHLSLVFKNSSQGCLLNAFIQDSGIGLFALFKPWRVTEKNGRYFMGIGAFNLIKRSTYQAIDGHRTICMHPIDDIMLGKIVRENGYTQECMLGEDSICVPWYDSVWAMIDGLMKNSFAIVHYRLPLIMLASVGVIIISILPTWGLIFGSGYIRLFFGISLLARFLVCYGAIKAQDLPGWYVIGSLMTPYLTLYTINRAALMTVLKGGIEWRGTFYALKELRRSKTLFF